MTKVNVMLIDNQIYVNSHDLFKALEKEIDAYEDIGSRLAILKIMKRLADIQVQVCKEADAGKIPNLRTKKGIFGWKMSGN